MGFDNVIWFIGGLIIGPPALLIILSLVVDGWDGLRETFRSKSTIEKEIILKQRDIERLKEQKENIDQLRRLCDEEQELFKEVQDYERSY